jgi:hypothetical protein
MPNCENEKIKTIEKTQTFILRGFSFLLTRRLQRNFYQHVVQILIRVNIPRSGFFWGGARKNIDTSVKSKVIDLQIPFQPDKESASIF